MSDTVYNVPFTSEYDYNFNVDFQEWIPLFEGLVHVHIGDGTSPEIIETIIDGKPTYTGGKAGYLYGKYSDGYWQDIGFVSDYNEAKKYCDDHGITIANYGDWVNLLMSLPENAVQAKLWAYGRDEGEWTVGKSSREQANRSMIWAVGSGADTDNGSPTNNSKYWAEQSKSYTDGKDLSGNVVQARTTDNAEYFKNLAKDWATKSTKVEGNLDSAKTYAENSKTEADRAAVWTQGSTTGSDQGSATNNAKYWTEQSKSYANGKDLNGNTVQARTTDNAQYYSNEAKGWANGTGSHANDNSKEYKLQSESWAKGTRDGSADTVRTNASTDNSKYYSERSQAWAETGTNLPSGSKSSKAWAADASASNTSAEQWATGGTGATYTSGKSAKEQADRAAVWASGSSTGNGSATNNAKYWSDQATSSAGSASADAIEASGYADNARASKEAAAASESNASQSASNASNSATLAQQWATGSTGGTYSAGKSAKEQADRAAVWAVGNSTGNGSAVNNAKYWSDQANSSAQSCTDQINAKLTEIQNATNAANSATSNANSAAAAANASADKVENLTATAESLESNQPATANVKTENNHYVIDFGIPRGLKGDQGEPNYLATSYVDDANESGVVFDWSADREGLSARTILVDPAASSTTTIYDVIRTITNSEIDALFA